MSSIHTIFFDLGNVLFAFDYERFHQQAHRGKQTTADAKKRLNHLAVELECGRMSEQQFLTELLSLYPSLETIENALACWSDIFTPIETTIAWVRQLRDSGNYITSASFPIPTGPHTSFAQAIRRAGLLRQPDP